GRSQIGECLRDLLDDLLLPRATACEFGDDPRAGAGYLPTRRADAGSLDRQRDPVQFGYLAVLSRAHGCSVSNAGWPRKTLCGRSHTVVRRNGIPAGLYSHFLSWNTVSAKYFVSTMRTTSRSSVKRLVSTSAPSSPPVHSFGREQSS